MFSSTKPSFLIFLLLLFFPLTFCRLPICASTSDFFIGQQVISPYAGTSVLAYADPTPYLFVYDDYSQKLKSVNIETGEFNVFHQVDFELGQMLFFPQGSVFIRNNTAGGQLVQWNIYTSLELQATQIQTALLGFNMNPFYPVYDQFSAEPNYFLILYNSTRVEIRYLNGGYLANYSNDYANFESLCTFPERNLIVTGDAYGNVQVWNITSNNTLNNTFNFTETQSYKVEFLERGKNAQYFLSADNLEKNLIVWSIQNLNVTYSIPVSFPEDSILGIKSVSNQSAVIFGNGFTFDYVNVVNGSIITSPTVPINTSIVSIDVLPNTFDGYERVAVLCSDGEVRVFQLSQTLGVSSVSDLFNPIFPQFKNITFANTFKIRNIDNTATSYMAVVTDAYNKTVWFIDETSKTNVTSFTYPLEVRGLYIVMASYLSTFQDMMLVWFGNSFRVYQMDDNLNVIQVQGWDAPPNITIKDLNLVYQVITYSYAYVSVVDQYNVTTILNITGTNVTSYVEPAGIKFFCNQNFFSNFAYCLLNDTLKVQTMSNTNFSMSSVYGLNTANTIKHPGMNDCFSKNIIGGGYYMTTNTSTTINWVWDGSYISYYNLTNITSLIIEGNPLYTTVDSVSQRVYEAVPGLGIVTNYSVGSAPSRNGFMYQFLENYFYLINQRELARYYLTCPMGTTQSTTLLGACFPNCNNSFISLTNSSCATQCLTGTYATPILDTYNNFTAMLCQNFNSSIQYCQNGISIGNNQPICSQCLIDYYLLATDSTDKASLYNLCTYYGSDPRLAAPDGTPNDGTGVAEWCNQLIKNCYECDWDPHHCQLCEWTFFRQLDGLCSNCTNNTLFHNGSSNGTGFCYNCSVALPYCYVCNGNDTNCTQCFNNYYFDERINLTCSDCSTKRYAKIGSDNGTGFCKNCSDVINNCLDCTEYGQQCTLCDPNLYIDVDYNCTMCNASNKYKNGSNNGLGLCEYCNYTLPHCLDCYGDDANCQLCMSYYYFYTNSSCVDCNESNYFHNGSSNGSGECYDCYLARPNCNWCNNNPDHCDLCFPNFWFDENNTCSNCSQTYFPNMFKNGSYNGSGECLYCEDAISNCNQCTNNATACLHCDLSYYIYYGIYNCSHCQDNASYFNGSGDGYHYCYPCDVAFNNCQLCNYTADECLLCTEDYFLNESYRCQPYTFRPQYNNMSLDNSTLNFTIVNNNRYLVLDNPCNYNHSLWNLDGRLHNYWVASLDFDLVNQLTLGDIENVVQPMNLTETQPNYSDPSMTFYGNSLHNILSFTGIQNAHYNVKYFCIYGNTFSDQTRPGVFDFYFPDNVGDNGLLYMNMDQEFDAPDLDLGLSIMACALQQAFTLGDTNQISTQSGNTCPDHQLVNISAMLDNTTNSSNSSNNSNNGNNNSLRMLQYSSSFAQSNTGSLITYIFSVQKNLFYVNDPTVATIQSQLLQTGFNQNLSLYMQAFDNSIFYPNPISGQFVITTNMLNINISYPFVQATFNATSKSTGVLTIITTGNDGFIYIGIEKNTTYNSTPTVAELINGVNDMGILMDFNAAMLIKQNQTINLTLNKLNPSLFYYLYLASQNLYGTNQSLVSEYKFATDARNIIQNIHTVESSINATPIIIGVVVGVVGLILIIVIVLCVIHRINMRNEESEAQSQQSKDKENQNEIREKYLAVNRGPSIENMDLKHPEKDIDPKAPTFETIPFATGVSERK